MRLLADVQPLQSGTSRQRGIGRYTAQLLGAMAARRPHWHIELVQSAHLEPPDADLLPGLPRRTFTPPFPAVPGRNEANERCYADWLTAQAPDAILISGLCVGPTLVPQFVGRRPPLFGVLYDLIPLLFADSYFTLASTQAHYAQLLRRTLQADCLLAISRAAAQDLRRLFHGPLPEVVAIGGAADPSFGPLPEGDLPAYRDRLRDRFGLGREFLLYVGGFDHRKNLRGALESFAALPVAARAPLDFVIACSLTAEQRRLLEGWAAELDIGPQVKLTGYVSDDELRALYQLCRLFFFPSLYEGLGLPVLEALQLGAPVVAPAHSSMPEVAGSVCVLADSCAPDELARAVLTALAEPRDAGAAARRQHAAGFRWDEVAESACRALERPRARPSPRRRRVAWVSPLPPSLSPVAGLAADLLGPLSGDFDIDAVVESAESPVPLAVAERHLVLTREEAIARHGADPYDLFVYHLADSPAHAYALDLLWRFRGVVVLHDPTLDHLARAAGRLGGWPRSLAAEPGTAPVRCVLRRADMVVTHSRQVWRAVRESVGVPAVHVPPVIAEPRAASRWLERERLGIPADAFLVCALAAPHAGCRVQPVLQAFAGLAPAIRNTALLAVVGHAPAGERQRLLAVAEQLGIAGRLRWPGSVPVADLGAYARAADVCVVLREPAHDGPWASVYRALTSGAACVFSDPGAMFGVPPGAALKVRTPDHEVEDLTAALRRLYESPEERAVLGRGAGRYACEAFGAEAVARRYVALLEMAAAARAATEDTWVELAAEAVATCCDQAPAAEAVEAWCRLRQQGQRQLRAAGRSEPDSPAMRRSA